MNKPQEILIILAIITFAFSMGQARSQPDSNFYTNLVEETSDNFAWHGIWVEQKTAAASGGSWRASGTLGDSVDIPFFGKGVSLIYAKGPTAPRVEITIDDISYGILDAASPTKIAEVKRLIADDLPEKNHTLTFKIISPGVQNGFVVDAIEVYTTKKPNVEEKQNYFIPVFLVVILVGGGYFGFNLLKKKKQIPAAAVIPPRTVKPKIVRPQIKVVEKVVKQKIRQDGKLILHQRALDIIKTLDKRDQEIINFLVENRGKAQQNKVRHAVNLPRSTMTKRVQILQAKNILRIKETGKINLLELTPWFLEKEEKEQ